MHVRRTCAAALVLGAALLESRSAAARESKEYGVSTPSGRDIYRQHTTFSDAKDTRDRDFVIEVAVGSGPEGNLGILLGWINKPVRGLEYYLGFGYEITPARLKDCPQDGPASAIAQVVGHAFPDLKVEIEASAVAP